MLEHLGSSSYFWSGFQTYVVGGCWWARPRASVCLLDSGRIWCAFLSLLSLVPCGAQSKHGNGAATGLGDRGSYSPWSEDCDPQLPDESRPSFPLHLAHGLPIRTGHLDSESDDRVILDSAMVVGWSMKTYSEDTWKPGDLKDPKISKGKWANATSCYNAKFCKTSTILVSSEVGLYGLLDTTALG